VPYLFGHSRRWARDKSPDGLRRRLLDQRRIDENGCWIWTGTVLNGERGGYGLIRVDGHHVRVHRLAAHLWRGFDLKSSAMIRHACDQPLCFNPDHLTPGEAAANSRDMVERGRSLGGAKNPRALLSQKHVIEMRALHASGISAAEIGRRYGVSRQLSWQVCTCRSYRGQ
jgi:hypothetical protein